MTLPIVICLPTGIVILPLAASIVVGPTVRPLCTTKLLFAMVPYSPWLNDCLYYFLIFIPNQWKKFYGNISKKIAPGGAISFQLTA
jgi:hypothetical protein